MGSGRRGRKGRAAGFSSGARFSHREGGRKPGKNQRRRERGEGLRASSLLHKQTAGLRASACTPLPLQKCCEITERLLIFNIFVKAPGPGVMRMRQDVSFQLKQIKRGFTSLRLTPRSGKETDPTSGQGKNLENRGVGRQRAPQEPPDSFTQHCKPRGASLWRQSPPSHLESRPDPSCRARPPLPGPGSRGCSGGSRAEPAAPLSPGSACLGAGFLRSQPAGQGTGEGGSGPPSSAGNPQDINHCPAGLGGQRRRLLPAASGGRAGPGWIWD